MKAKLLTCTLIMLCHMGMLIAQDLPTLSDVPDSLLQGAHAVILDDETIVSHTGNKYRCQYRKTVAILNKKAESYQHLIFGYKENSEKLIDISAIITTADGELIKKVKKKEFSDVSMGDGYSIISDYRAKHYDYTSDDYPLIVHYDYTIESENTLMLPSWIPIDGHKISVLQSSYELYTDQDIRVKELNIESYPITRQKKHHYTLAHQPAVRSESYSPSIYEIFPMVYLSPTSFSYEGYEGQVETWDDYAKWIDTHFLQKKMNEMQIDESAVSDLVKSANSDIEKAQILYRYLQDNTRYISISTAEGGLNPMPPAKVDEVKYGDCKALSFYYMAMLRSQDIDAHYVEVHASSSDQRGLYPNYPAPVPGNHIIVCIPQETDSIWVDCTSDYNAFDYLGPFTDDRDVLLISADGGDLVRTPHYDEHHRSTDTISISWTEDDSYQLSAQSSHSGQYRGSHLHLLRSTPSDHEKYIREDWAKGLRIKNISQHSITDADTHDILSTTYDMEIDDPYEHAGDYLFLPMKERYQMDIPLLPKDGNRENDIVFNRTHQQELYIILSLPEPYELVAEIDETHESPYGQYSIKSTRISPREIMLEKLLKVNKGRYTPTEYHEIKSFFDKAKKTDITTITLTQTTN